MVRGIISQEVINILKSFVSFKAFLKKVDFFQASHKWLICTHFSPKLMAAQNMK